MRCAKLRVPLDRTGGLPGSIDLRVARVRLSDKRRPPFLMYLSGGPGGAGVVEGRSEHAIRSGRLPTPSGCGAAW